MANQFCNSCGSSMEANATFCTNCGATKVNSAQPVQQQYANPAPSYVPPVQQPYYQQPAQPNYANNNAMNTQPLGVGQYIGMFILMGIPFVGFILMLVWSFGSNVNVNKKNYARATLILGIIGGILLVIFYGALIAILPSILETLSGGYGSYY